MIDFEEELKKFEPSMEVEEAEEEIQKRDLTDLTDILRQMTEQKRGDRSRHEMLYVWHPCGS